MLPLLLAALLGQASDVRPSAPPPGPEWIGLPGEAAPPPPAPPDARPPPVTSLPMPPTIEEPLGGASPSLVYRPEPPNKVSLHGAAPLTPGRRAATVAMGFPMLGARAMIGVTPSLDLGLSYETLYGLMHDARAAARWLVWNSGGLNLGVVGDAGAAFFGRLPTNDFRGSRWLTGRRNVNASGGVVLSMQGESPRSSRFFLSGRCMLSLDTQPVQIDPLGGTPPPVLVAPNLITEIGLEAPVSEWVSLVFRVGMDLHGRPDDSLVMVTGAAGVVTALP